MELKNGYWKELRDEALNHKIDALIEENDGEVSLALIKDSLGVLKAKIYREVQFNSKMIDQVNVKNGELKYYNKTKSWKLAQHQKENYRTTQIPVIYDPQAAAPLFTNFLCEIFEEDEDKAEKIKLTKQMMGYALITSMKYEVFFLLVGEGANGKSVLLNVIIALLGKGNVCSINLEDLDKPFVRAELKDKHANIVTEMPYGAMLPDAAIKSITSGENMTVSRKFGQPFNLSPFAKLIASTNNMPFSRDSSVGFFRRARILTFNNEFSGKNADKNLSKKLINELPGILNLALDGLAEIFDEGEIIEPSSSHSAKDLWRTQIDQARSFYECCCLDPTQSENSNISREILNNIVPSIEVFSKFKAYAAEEGIYKPLTKKTLTQRLVKLNKGIELYKEPKGGKRSLRGIKFKPNF